MLVHSNDSALEMIARGMRPTDSDFDSRVHLAGAFAMEAICVLIECAIDAYL